MADQKIGIQCLTGDRGEHVLHLDRTVLWLLGVHNLELRGYPGLGRSSFGHPDVRHAIEPYPPTLLAFVIGT